MATWVDIDDVHFAKIREVAIVTENMRKRSECKGSVHDQAKKFLTVMDSLIYLLVSGLPC